MDRMKVKIFRSGNYPETCGMLVSIWKTGKQKHHLPVHQEVVLWPIITNRLVLEVEQMPNQTTTLMAKQESSSTKKRKNTTHRSCNRWCLVCK